MNGHGLVVRVGLPAAVLGLIAVTLASLGHAADPRGSDAGALIADRVTSGWSLDERVSASPGALADGMRRIRDGGRISAGFHVTSTRRPPAGANWTICDRLAFERRWGTEDVVQARSADACRSRLFATAATAPQTRTE